MIDHPYPRESESPIRKAFAIGIIIVSLCLGLGTCSMLDHIGRAQYEQAKAGIGARGH